MSWGFGGGGFWSLWHVGAPIARNGFGVGVRMERGRTCGGCGGGGEGGGEGGGGGADGGAALGGGAAPLRNQPWQDAPRSPSCYTTTTSQRCACHSHFPPFLAAVGAPAGGVAEGAPSHTWCGGRVSRGLGWYWPGHTLVLEKKNPLSGVGPSLSGSALRRCCGGVLPLRLHARR